MAQRAVVPDTRTRILEHARDLYVEGGMVGFSMRKVAARAKLTATAIYRHFATKEALLTAVAERGFERFAAALWEALAEPTPLGRLERAVVQYRRFAVENPGYYRVMFMTSVEDLGYREMPGNNQEKLGRTFQFLVDRVHECTGAGVLRGGDAIAISFTIWSHLHGLVALYLTGNCRIIPDAGTFASAYDASVRRLFDGLLTT